MALSHRSLCQGSRAQIEKSIVKCYFFSTKPSYMCHQEAFLRSQNNALTRALYPTMYKATPQGKGVRNKLYILSRVGDRGWGLGEGGRGDKGAHNCMKCGCEMQARHGGQKIYLYMYVCFLCFMSHMHRNRDIDRQVDRESERSCNNVKDLRCTFFHVLNIALRFVTFHISEKNPFTSQRKHVNTHTTLAYTHSRASDVKIASVFTISN